MEFDTFCRINQLPDSVKAALTEQDFDGPQTLVSSPTDLYTQGTDKKGHSMKVGAAIRLKNASIAWVQGDRDIAA